MQADVIEAVVSTEYNINAAQTPLATVLNCLQGESCQTLRSRAT